NDNTCEGVNYTNMPAFSVQFHPEACGGPHDTAFLFDRFIELMKNNKK
ncbi:MAG: carbamoyl phosphate synthase small subunit, partial [Ruminococcus bromii]